MYRLKEQQFQRGEREKEADKERRRRRAQQKQAGQGRGCFSDIIYEYDRNLYQFSNCVVLERSQIIHANKQLDLYNNKKFDFVIRRPVISFVLRFYFVDKSEDTHRMDCSKWENS